MKKVLLILIGVILTLQAFARDYGNDIYQQEVRYRVTCNVLNVRNQPGSNGRVIFTARNGDYIYGSVVPSNPDWIQVSGNNWFVSSTYVAEEENPHYNQMPDEEMVDTNTVYERQTTIRWCLLVLCIGLFAAALYFLGPKIWALARSSMDGKDGMIQKFYYGWQSYASVLSFVGLILASILAGVLILLIVGGTVWLALALFWLILKILIIVGGIALIGGILGMLTDEKGIGCGAIIGGGLIMSCKGTINAFGAMLLDTGFSFMKSLYIVDFVRDLAIIYWRPALLIAAIPLCIFLLAVAITFLVAVIFMLAEYIVIRRYNIKNPCPVCQHASEPARYLSQGIELPINLHPGKYGIFHVTHPKTGEKMPTMLFNGKDQLQRRCHHCNSIISAKMGTEKHVVLAGVAESGKTTLVYRLIAELFRKYSGKIDFTDEVDWNMKEDIQEVVKRGFIREFPHKTAVGVMRSIQLLIQRKTLAYRLFINDVGGELYDLAAVDSEMAKEMAQFVRNAETILFLVDPMTIDFTGLELSPAFKQWLGKQSDRNIEKINLSDAFKRMQQLFERQLSKKQMQAIHFNVVLVKQDLNYLGGIDTSDEAALKEFIRIDMGLQHLMADIETVFTPERTHFFAFSAVKADEAESHAGQLTDAMLTQLNITE